MSLTMERDYYLQLKEDLGRFKGYCKTNVGALLTILYMIGSSAGIVYLYLLMDSFNVNVFNHIELSDYLLALLTNQVILLVFFVFCIVYVPFLALRLKYPPKEKRDNFLNRFYVKLIKPLYIIPGIWLLAILFYAALIFYSATIAKEDATRLKERPINLYQVTLNYPIFIGELQTMQLSRIKLITSTNSNLFLYHEDLKEVIILPQSNLAAMTPIKPEPVESETEPEPVN